MDQIVIYEFPKYLDLQTFSGLSRANKHYYGLISTNWIQIISGLVTHAENVDVEARILSKVISLEKKDIWINLCIKFPEKMTTCAVAISIATLINIMVKRARKD